MSTTGRKRKQLPAAEQTGNKQAKQTAASPVGQEVREVSLYFSSRLGEDFFNQPCVSLAKAFLGKVTE